MCFSAVASFAASGVLMTGGIATVRVAKSKNQLVFAAIPILFSIQQFFEGFVWLSLTNPEYANWQIPSTYTFLVFAQVVWPFIVPVSIYLLEKDEKRKKIFLFLMLAGATVSVYLATCISIYPVHASINSHHIRYDLDFPSFNINYKGALYFLATVIPAFVSSIKWMRIFGLSILISFLITEIYFQEYLISVWCYFAAILSITIYFILFKANKSN